MFVTLVRKIFYSEHLTSFLLLNLYFDKSITLFNKKKALQQNKIIIPHSFRTSAEYDHFSLNN